MNSPYLKPNPNEHHAAPSVLVKNKLFQQFFAAGYVWISHERAAGLHEFQGCLHRHYYESIDPNDDQRTYSVTIRIADLFNIENYPRDGTAVRFLFTVHVSYHNVNAGQQMSSVQMQWRVHSVEDVEKPAYWFWRKFEEQHA